MKIEGSTIELEYGEFVCVKETRETKPDHFPTIAIIGVKLIRGEPDTFSWESEKWNIREERKNESSGLFTLYTSNFKTAPVTFLVSKRVEAISKSLWEKIQESYVLIMYRSGIVPPNADWYHWKIMKKEGYLWLFPTARYSSLGVKSLVVVPDNLDFVDFTFTFNEGSEIHYHRKVIKSGISYLETRS